MANFDEDIKRITDEILSDGTVDQIIREKVTDGIEKAIVSSFNYGKLEKAVKKTRAAKGDCSPVDDWDYEVPGQMELSDFIEMPEGGNDDD